MSTTRVMVRNSERSDFTQCRQKWFWAYVDRLRPIDTGMNPLIFGDIVHRSMSAFYIPEKSRKKCVRGVHPMETLDKIFSALEVSDPAMAATTAFQDHWELGLGMMKAYYEQYGDDDDYMIVYPEMPFQLDIYNDDGLYVCTLVGTTDALVRWRSTGSLGLFEHKTAAQINTDHLSLDEQANTYWTVVPIWLRENGVIRPDQDIEFMDYNFMKKSVADDDRPQNADGLYLNSPKVAALKEALDADGAEYRKSLKKDDLIALAEERGMDWQSLGEISATQGPELFHRQRVFRNEHQRVRTMDRILSQVREMKQVRHGNMDLYKSPSKNCSWCQYRDLCEMDEYGDDTTYFEEHSFRKWNPYADHIWSLEIPS